MRLRRRLAGYDWSQPNPVGLSGIELRELADYNAERARGLVHTPEWDALMAERQAHFNVTNWIKPSPAGRTTAADTEGA